MVPYQTVACEEQHRIATPSRKRATVYRRCDVIKKKTGRISESLDLTCTEPKLCEKKMSEALHMYSENSGAEACPTIQEKN